MYINHKYHGQAITTALCTIAYTQQQVYECKNIKQAQPFR